MLCLKHFSFPPFRRFEVSQRTVKPVCFVLFAGRVRLLRIKDMEFPDSPIISTTENGNPESYLSKLVLRESGRLVGVRGAVNHILGT